MPTFTREELYERVWATPVRTLAEEFGISDVGLKKACKRADIPIPERGYWARAAAGKTVIKVKLPPRAPGMHNEISIGATSGRRWIWPPDPEAELAEPEPVEPVFAEPIEAVEARVRKSVGKVSAVRTLDADLHPHVRKLLEKDEEKRQKQAASRYPSSWDDPLFTSPFEQRRLKVLNSLFLALARQGARPSVGGRVGRDVYVSVGSTNLTLSLDHPKAKKSRWDEAQIHGGAVDDLKLEVTWPKEGQLLWQDGEAGKLETQLTEIVIALMVAGERFYRDHCFDRYRGQLERREEMRQLLIKQREEAERRERERLAALEQRRRETLFGMARDWRAAEDIRSFVGMVISLKGGAEAGAWREWAMGVADRLDPLTGAPLLMDVEAPEAPAVDAADDGDGFESE